jgi:hypothetical protein
LLLSRGLRWLEDERWYVGSTRKFDAHSRLFVRLKVVLCQLLAKLSGFDTYHGVISRVVADRAPEHLSSDHPLSQAIDVAFQSVPNDEVEKILGPFTSRECTTRYDFLEMAANQTDLL